MENNYSINKDLLSNTLILQNKDASLISAIMRHGNKLTSRIVKFKMLVEYNDQLFKCRICNTAFRSPEELRIHRMVQHKGHMLSANHR